MYTQVAQDGSCLFHSLRRNLDCPKEFTSVHLRRQVICFIADHAEYYINDQTFIEGLRGTYGWDGTQGLSFLTYLEMMLSPHSWGDELFLYAMSHMWGVGITLLYPSENNREHKIRHSMPLSEAHFALLYTGHSHYSRIGKSRRSP